MPPKKRKISTTGTSKRKKAKKDTSTTVIPDRTRPDNTTLISSDPLYQAKFRGKVKSDPIPILDDSDDASDPFQGDEGFYTSGSGNTTASPVQQNLTKLFDSYRDKSDQPDKIFIEGAQKYLESLSIALDEVVHLALCDLISCPSIGEIDREAFITGWTTTSASASPTSLTPSKPLDSISRQQAYISTLRKRIPTDPTYFRQVYRSAFKLAKANEAARSVPLEAAIEFWRMFFSSSSGGIEWSTKSTPWLDMWCDFYEQNIKRPVNKDLWNMVGELVQKIKEPGGESLEWWTEDGAWPMAVDEFVALVKEKRKGSGDVMETV